MFLTSNWHKYIMKRVALGKLVCSIQNSYIIYYNYTLYNIYHIIYYISEFFMTEFYGTYTLIFLIITTKLVVDSISSMTDIGSLFL